MLLALGPSQHVHAAASGIAPAVASAVSAPCDAPADSDEVGQPHCGICCNALRAVLLATDGLRGPVVTISRSPRIGGALPVEFTHPGVPAPPPRRDAAA